MQTSSPSHFFSPTSPTQSTEENPNLSEIFLKNEKLSSKFKILKKIDNGSFGEIYKATHIQTNQDVAIKVEKKSPNEKIPLISKEAKILLDLEGTPGFPKMFYFLKGDLHSFLVLSLLGKNLEKCKLLHSQLSPKTVIMLGSQCITRLEALHNRGIIHRDIKPENFLMGVNKNASIVYMIDFGLSKTFMDNGKHIPNTFKKRGLVGTARYASVNAHLGNELSRKDDLESLMYMLAYLMNGRLPWQDLLARSKEEKYEKILQKKIEVTAEKLFEECPKKFVQVFKYIKNLEFEEQPDYKKIKELFNDMMKEGGWKFDYKYEWENEEERRSRNSVKINSEIRFSSKNWGGWAGLDGGISEEGKVLMMAKETPKLNQRYIMGEIREISIYFFLKSF